MGTKHTPTRETAELVDGLKVGKQLVVARELIFRLDQAEYSRTLSVEETELRMELINSSTNVRLIKSRHVDVSSPRASTSPNYVLGVQVIRLIIKVLWVN
jgi:hypothetical protein